MEDRAQPRFREPREDRSDGDDAAHAAPAHRRAAPRSVAPALCFAWRDGARHGRMRELVAPSHELEASLKEPAEPVGGEGDHQGRSNLGEEGDDAPGSILLILCVTAVRLDDATAAASEEPMRQAMKMSTSG